MNATTLLKKDHQTVKELFKQYDHAKDGQKRGIFDNIRRELLIHAQIEEQIFYPAMFDSKAKDTVKEGLEEHHVVERLLDELSVMDPKDEQYDAKMKVLKENVEHHIQEEEGEVFGIAKKTFSSEGLEELGEQMADFKKALIKETEMSAS